MTDSFNNFNFSTLVDLLRYRALHQPDQRAFTFLQDGETESISLTYQELDRQARAIAAQLQSLGLSGDRALLLYSPGLEFIAAFFGCLYAGVVAVPAYPPRRNHHLTRLQSIVTDAQAKAVLTTTSVLSNVEQWFASAPELAALHWLATDNIANNLEQGWQEPTVSSDTLAFLQYTSGSTGRPKGVMVSHGNLLQNLTDIDLGWEHTSDSVIVTWLPTFHDMGLIYGALQPVFKGIPCYMMAPVAFLQRPIRWLEAISRYKATHSGAPNFAYELCVSKVTSEQIATLDLSSWRMALNGAEPVRADALKRFAETFKPCGFDQTAFCPGYGLAEATLKVSTVQKKNMPIFYQVQAEALQQNRVVEATNHQESVRTLVGCGRTEIDTKIVIVNPETLTACASDEVGEIWVSGSTVAQGYWGRTEETEKTFRAYIADTGEGPFLRTGDLGFLKDGELFVTGRIKDVVIIRGRNHYPQDIELTAQQSHPALRPDGNAAFTVEVDGEQLVIACEVERTQLRKLNVDEIVGAIRKAVSEHHELQVYAVVLLKPSSIPKTSSGKIQRRACREEFLTNSLDVVGRWQQNNPNSESHNLPKQEHFDEDFQRKQKSQTVEELEKWLLNKIALSLKVKPQEIDIREPFASYGLDSVQAVEISAELEKLLECRLPDTLVYDYPNIEALAQHLDEKTKQPFIPTPLTSTQQKPENEGFAIIGIGCRFPGANNPQAFWQLLQNGVDAIAEIPSTRGDDWTCEKTARLGGFLNEVDYFEPQFFKISAREAQSMDPQQRLLLEVSWEALEDGGLTPEQLTGSNTGVFIGISTSDYSRLPSNSLDCPYWSVGNSFSIAANRLSYVLNLHGPSLAVDTACSSSLVAVHQACQSLRQEECQLAIAGGVNIILNPELTVNFFKAGMIAADGHCKTFDASADGYVRGEGCGIVVLKRLSDALKDGDHIYAVVRGSAVNQDGRSNGLTAPNGLSQQAVIRKALENAKLQPAQISYIEAHGTGTSLGDPIEVNSLKQVLMSGREPEQPAWIGSVKTNIGHLEAAAGIAGLIKVALSLKHKEIPPHLHLKQLNSEIDLEGTPLSIPTQRQKWSAGKEFRKAGVSSFGFGGTNAHVILEEAPHATPIKSEFERSKHLLTLSAKSDKALKELAQKYEKFLASKPEVSVADVCFTANTGRSHFEYRLAVIAESTQQLGEQLRAFATGKPTGLVTHQVSSRHHHPKIAFLFTGQGSQYPGMGRQLYETQPVFRQALERCDEILRSYLEQPLLSVLYPASDTSPLLNETAYTQPALFSVEYALFQLWKSWGILPDVVIGHSVGEYAAACVAGVFSLEDGLKLIAERARLMQALPPNGAMAAVFADERRVAAAIALYATTVSIAAVNGPNQIVISGAREAVQMALKQLESQGISAKALNVSHAFHSPLMEPMLESFEQIAASVKFNAPRIPVISNLTGKIFNPEDILDRTYWCRHIREAVRFSTGMETLHQQGYDLFVELGPNSTLIGMGRQCLPEGVGTWLPSLKKGEENWQQLLNSLGTLYTRGVEVNWSGFDQVFQRCRIPLPTYPFQRQRFWIQTKEGNNMENSSKEEKHLLSANSPELKSPVCTPAQLFYTWQWRPESLVESGEISSGAVLIFKDSQMVANNLEKLLGTEKYTIYFVTSGQEFKQKKSRHLTINPACYEDYEKLIRVVKEDGLKITAAIHLWNFSQALVSRMPVSSNDPVLQEGVYSVLFLGQALMKHYPDHPINLLLVTQGAYVTSANESFQALHQSMGATLAQTLAQESKTIQTRVVDVTSHLPSETLAKILFQEMKAKPSEEGIVAIRQEQRLIRTLEKIEVSSSDDSDPPVKSGETWLITGGTSDVGVEIAKGLIRQAPINLVLTGRHPLPPKEDWGTLPKDDNTTNQRIRVIQDLERFGATVMYQAVDVTDAEGMQELMEAIRVRFGHLDAVIHAAGVQDTTTFKLIQKKPDTVTRVFAPKVQGTIILDNITQDEPLKYFVVISSAAASKAEWGANLGDYAAANIFLDNYATYRAGRGAPGRSLAVNFSLWRDKGMAKIGGLALVSVAKVKGLNLLEPEQATNAFIQALSKNDSVIHIIDLMKRAVEVTPQPSPFQKATAVLEDMPTSQPKTRSMRLLVREILSQYLTIPEQQVEGYITFQDLGLDSLGSVEAIKQLGLTLKKQLSPTLFFEYQTPDELADYLEKQYGPVSSSVETSTKLEENTSKSQPSTKLEEDTIKSQKFQQLSFKAAEVQEQDIAIIGMACKVPGADNLAQYWELLNEKRSAIQEVPSERWLVEDYFEENGTAAHTTYCKRAGFVKDPFDFDPMFFGISPREATAMDPQQRLFLEAAWQALQQAGYGGRYRTKEIGVFVGGDQNNYVEHFFNYQYYAVLIQRLQKSSWFNRLSAKERNNLLSTISEVLKPSEILPETTAGNELNQIAARVSHCLNLSGPSMEIGTACSSSLVALHLACQSLRSGETPIAIAGGVNLNLSPSPFTFLSRVQAFSPTGTCYPFDHRANGMVLGEGVGVVILKPLKQALEDGDFIHAVIKGSAVNNDGHSQGITAPNPEGQAEAVRKAYTTFGIDPQTISYIEAHGTGTMLGDPVEIEGLTKAFRDFTSRRGFCAIGSVKSSIGHLMAGSGVVSLIKVVLAMQHGKIPATVGFEKPNPHINFADTPFYVVGGEGTPWSENGSPLRAGVNGFGFGGTNCHVILEQSPVLSSVNSKEQSSSPQLLCLTGRNQKVLKEVASQLREHIVKHPEQELSQICFTLNNAQRDLSYKTALLVNDRQQMLDSLNAICLEETKPDIYIGRSNPQRATPIHLVMDGSSALTPEEAKILGKRFPQFQKAYTDCEFHWRRAVSDGDLNGHSILSGKAHAFAVQYALSNLLMSLQLQPNSLLVEETGVLVGASLAEMLPLEQAMLLLAQLEGKQINTPLEVSRLETRLASVCTCPLVTPRGTFKYPVKFTNLQLGSLFQASESLAAEHCREVDSEGGVNLHLGGSVSIRQQLGIADEPQVWLCLEKEQPIVNRLLTIMARLYIAGVRFNSTGLFPQGLRRVPLPTYPFEHKTYKPSITHTEVPSDEENHQEPMVSPELLLIKQLSPLSQAQRQSSYVALSKELGIVSHPAQNGHSRNPKIEGIG